MSTPMPMPMPMPVSSSGWPNINCCPLCPILVSRTAGFITFPFVNTKTHKKPGAPTAQHLGTLSTFVPGLSQYLESPGEAHRRTCRKELPGPGVVTFPPCGDAGAPQTRRNTHHEETRWPRFPRLGEKNKAPLFLPISPNPKKKPGHQPSAISPPLPPSRVPHFRRLRAGAN